MKYCYKINLLFIIFCSLLLTHNCFSQNTKVKSKKPSPGQPTNSTEKKKNEINIPKNKIYIPSGNGYYNISEITEWLETDLQLYKGKYVYIYPAYDEFGEWAGDGVCDEMSVVFSNDSVYITSKMQVEGWGEPETTIRKFQYPMDFVKNYGKFVKLNYRDSSNRIITTKGILTISGNKTEDFYEKSPDAGKNALFLFNKPLRFNYNVDEFQVLFPEFVLSEKDNTGNGVYNYSSSNSSKSGQYVIEVIFSQDFIKEVRMTGQRTEEFNEFDKLRFSIQDEFFYVRNTEIEERYTSYFEKNDLKAEIAFGETTYITILWK